MLEEGVITPNTVICLERKEDGNNFGMKDVKILASILMYNEKNKHYLPISESIKLSAIYQDAVLYNKAKTCGIEVLGIEGKHLQLNKNSPNYEKARESHMANRINQLTESGKNVILPLGSSHVLGLKRQLEGRIVVLDEKSKSEKLQLTTAVSNMKESLQKASASSVLEVSFIPQNKKKIQQSR